jgi:hypothetical protein
MLGAPDIQDINAFVVRGVRGPLTGAVRIARRDLRPFLELAEEGALAALEAILASPGAQAATDMVAESGLDERFADRLVDSPATERVLDRVMTGPLLEDAVARLLESEELWVLVDEIAHSPSVTDAIGQQGIGFADQVAGVVRERSSRADARLERIARRLARRAPRTAEP